MFFKNHTNLWQLVLLGAVATSFIFVKSWLSFKSFFLGSSSWIIPQIYFLWKMRQIKVILNSKKMLNFFFLGEIVKLLLSFGMIAVIFLLVDVDGIIFLSGYAFMIIASFLMLIKIGAKKNA
jgi:F0F1-type ATP synthase assembly protein I